MFKTKYRIKVEESLAGVYFNAEYKKWFMPFFMNCFGYIGYPSREDAKKAIDRHKNRIVCEK